MGTATILVMQPVPFEQTFVPTSNSLNIKFEFDWPSGFRDVWNVDGRTPPESVLYYLLTHEHLAQVS